MLVGSLISGVFGGLVTATYAVLNGAGWGMALLAYSGGGMAAMLATLMMVIGLSWARTTVTARNTVLGSVPR